MSPTFEFGARKTWGSALPRPLRNCTATGSSTNTGVSSETVRLEACAERLAGLSFEKARETLFPVAGAAPYSRGFAECVRVLREHYVTGIVSSGLSMVAEEIRRSLGMQFEVSNELGVRQGEFDGTFHVRVPFDHKLKVVTVQAEKLKLPLANLCFVGDSPNDIPVLETVGYPVAYRPKTPEVAEAARGNVIGDFLQLPRLLENLRPK